MSDNWVVATLEDALSNWNDKLAEIWSLVSQTPESFRGGEIWTVIVSIHNALVGLGYGLLVLFFAMGVFRSAASFRELQRPEFALRHFIRFLLAKVAVGSSLELITAIYKICGGVVSTVMGGIGSAISTTATLPDKIVEAIEDVSFLESIPLWLVSLLGSLLITILSYALILTVYGRFFKIFIYTAIAPLPLASFAGEATSRTGQTFLKSYVGVCMEGAVIVLSCVIYSAFLSGGSTALDESLPAVTMVWQYIGQLMFNMLVLTGLVKGSDRLVREMMGYRELGFQSVFIRPLTKLGTAIPNWSEIGYSASGFVQFYRECLSYILELNKQGKPFSEGHAGIFLSKILSGHAQNYMELRSPCGATIGQAAYYFNGDVYTCDEGRMIAEMGDSAFKLGNVYKNSYDEMMSSPVCKTVCAASVLESLPECTDCVYQPYCGTCPALNYASEHNVFKRDARGYRCQIYRGMLDAIFAILFRNDPKDIEILQTW